MAARSDCRIGNYGDAKLVGGPLLPNVGIGPKSYILGNIPIGISVAILVLLFLMQREHKFSSKF
ncbi:MAG: hypothetical protein Q7S79_04200 [bacterium]|nr:hypothetical protein [bacterium]